MKWQSGGRSADLEDNRGRRMSTGAMVGGCGGIIGLILALVFGLGVLTSSLLNNDAAILVLTPVVLTMVARRYPGQPAMLVPFAFVYTPSLLLVDFAWIPFLTALTGSSFGQSLARIGIVRLDGQRLGWPRALARAAK